MEASSTGNGRVGQNSSQTPRRESWSGFWLSVVRIFLCEVVLLAALAGTAVAYLNWSSEKSFAEFQTPRSAAHLFKSSNPCDPGA